MSVRRQIITIDEEKCTGCGECIPNCPEGALQIIDGKARLVSDLFCDGLGACIGHCPEGAISVEEREAEPYDERRVMANIIKQGPKVIRAHLEHLSGHGETALLKQALDVLEEQGIEVPAATDLAPENAGAGGCPGTMMKSLGDRLDTADGPAPTAPSRMRNWPVQLTLVPPHAPYLQNADLLIAADCAPFAYGNFHEDFVKGKVVLVGCPKLDDAKFYRKKLGMLFEQNDVRSVEVVHMEVPCCSGLVRVVQAALADAGKDVPLTLTQVGIDGSIQENT